MILSTGVSVSTLAMPPTNPRKLSLVTTNVISTNPPSPLQVHVGGLRSRSVHRISGVCNAPERGCSRYGGARHLAVAAGDAGQLDDLHLGRRIPVQAVDDPVTRAVRDAKRVAIATERSHDRLHVGSSPVRRVGVGSARHQRIGNEVFPAQQRLLPCQRLPRARRRQRDQFRAAEEREAERCAGRCEATTEHTTTSTTALRFDRNSPSFTTARVARCKSALGHRRRAHVTANHAPDHRPTAPDFPGGEPGQARCLAARARALRGE